MATQRQSKTDSQPPRPGTLGIEQRFVQRWRDVRAALSGPLVVGFSGGPDSLALAVLLARLHAVLKREVVLAHVDHGLRAESATEAQQARVLAVQLGLPFALTTLSDHPRARHPSVGVEEAARRERYLALAAVASDFGATTLVLAHHRDDQAETVLLHLLRGAGLTGASGFRELTEMDVPWWRTGAEQPRTRLTLWRPLIGESRTDLMDYLRQVAPRLDPVADQSNRTDDFRRNALRNSVLPLLEEIVPGASAALARFAAVAAEEDDLLDALAGQELAKTVQADGTLNVSALKRLHPALRRRVMRTWLLRRGAPSELSLERVQAVIDGCLASRGGWRIEVGGGMVVGRQGSSIFVVGRDDHQSATGGDASHHSR